MIKSIKNSMNCGYVRDNKADLQQYLKIDLDKLLEDGTKEELRIPEVRVATQDFGFGVKLAHDLDVRSLDQALKSVEKWHENTTLRKKMMAPLLPIIIQCSGTGKSRLLTEF